jgi:hypothetical protein
MSVAAGSHVETAARELAGSSVGVRSVSETH